MKTGPVYTVVFMFVVSVIFTGTLALMNQVSSDKIEYNQELDKKLAIIHSLDINADNSNVDEIYSTSIQEKLIDGSTIYEKIETDGSVSAFVISFQGPGLWGTIKGFLAVSSDLKNIIGIEFTEQNETPGLGGRISEDWYKDQFQGIDISNREQIVYGDDIDAITGATSSSNAVMKILNDIIQNSLPTSEVVN